MTALAAVATAGAVVGHGQLHVPAAEADEHLGMLGPRVLDGVRQPLLDEAVRGQVEPAG